MFPGKSRSLAVTKKITFPSIAFILSLSYMGCYAGVPQNGNTLNIQNLIEQEGKENATIELTNPNSSKGWEIEYRTDRKVDLQLPIRSRRLTSSEIKEKEILVLPKKYDIYLLLFQLTFHPLKEHGPPAVEADIIEANINIALQKGAYSLVLHPKSEVIKESLETTLTIQPKVEYKGVSLEILKYELPIRFTTKKRVITSFGEGGSNFYWQFKCRNEDEFVGDYQLLAVVAVPRGVKKLPTQINIETKKSYAVAGVVDLVFATTPKPYSETIFFEN